LVGSDFSNSEPKTARLSPLNVLLVNFFIFEFRIEVFRLALLTLVQKENSFQSIFFSPSRAELLIHQTFA